MAVTPTGKLSLPLKHLQDTIANSSNFQTWVGALDAAAAKAFIHVEYSETLAGPFAVIDWSNDFVRDYDSAGPQGNNFMQVAATLQLIFKGTVNTELDDVDNKYTFLNNIGGILDDIETNAGQGGYLDITQIRFLEGPMRPLPKERNTDIGDFQRIIFLVDFQGI